MANYVEYIKVGTGESWQVRDPDAQSSIARLGESVEDLNWRVTEMSEEIGESIDSIDSRMFENTGGTMSGDVNMNGNAITGLPDPANDSDPATKKYVDLSMKNISKVDTIVAVPANAAVGIDLAEGEVIIFTYCTSSMSDSTVTLLVNSLNPTNSAYHYGSENWTNRAITQCGATCFADFTGTMRVLNGRVHLSGSGLRGNGSGMGHAAMQWNDVGSVETLTFNQAGTLAYRKL